MHNTTQFETKIKQPLKRCISETNRYAKLKSFQSTMILVHYLIHSELPLTLQKLKLFVPITVESFLYIFSSILVMWSFFVRSEVLRIVTKKITVFQNVAPCNHVDSVEETCLLPPLLESLFYLENAGNMLLHNTSNYLQHYMA